MELSEDRRTLTEAVAARRAINAAVAAHMGKMDDHVHARTAFPTRGSDARVTEKDLYTSAVCELAAALTTRFGSIHNDIQIWRLMQPGVRQEFVDGNIDRERVATIHEHLLNARPETVAMLEGEILRAAKEMAPGNLGREIDRLLTEADPTWDRESRKRAAATEKSVRQRRIPRGMRSVTSRMTDAEADELFVRLDVEVARLCKEDPRSTDQRLGDANTAITRGEELQCLCSRCTVADPSDATDGAAAAADSNEPESKDADGDGDSSDGGLSDGGLSDGGLSDEDSVGEDRSDDTAGSDTACIDARVPNPDAPQPNPSGLDLPGPRSGDAEETGDTGDPPPHRQGGGSLIEHWRARIEADPTAAHAQYPDGHGGHTDAPAGALTYKPSRALAAQIRAEHPYCMHPGCNVLSDSCDLDHIIEFDHADPYRGGWTISSNVRPDCRLHHNLKTRKLWDTELLPDGVLHTIDPLGNHYFTAPTL